MASLSRRLTASELLCDFGGHVELLCLQTFTCLRTEEVVCVIFSLTRLSEYLIVLRI